MIIPTWIKKYSFILKSSFLFFRYSIAYYSIFVLMFLRVLTIMLLLAAFSFGETLSLALPDSMESLVEKATAQTMSLDYKAALKTAESLKAKDEGVGCVIESIVRVSMYDDLGDTNALVKASASLEKCKTQGLWQGLQMFELGFVQNEQGHSFKGAMKTRSAAKLFEESKELDPQAFYAIYAYYVDQSFSWLPFKSDNRSHYLSVLDSASKISKRFWPLFLTPLIWMYYDKEDFKKGLELSERGLRKTPNHPVLLQIKADMLYRLKRYDEAAKIYEQSAESYLKRTGKSIRYWCSVLNLIRIYNDKGDKDKAASWREKLKDPMFKAQEKWMPGSLMDDLKKRKLL